MTFANKFLSIALVIASSTQFSGCKSELSPSDPRVLGVPTQTAFLGVEFEYNFGAEGGGGLLDYSLSNSPDWFSLEETTNKARHGVIGRGVPGITGGRRGELDLGTTSNVAITVNDGGRTGTNTFEIEVKHNTLALTEVTVAEGESNGYVKDPNVEKEPETPATECVKPAGDVTGVYTVDGKEYKTYPVVMSLVLAQPSVEPVKVRYELTSEFIDITDPAKKDAQEKQNLSKARPLYDYVSDSHSLAELSYLQSESMGGVVTFNPGVTTCYIRVEVIDDIKAERTETFHVELKEVVSGLASFTADKSKAKAGINIQDNEPVVSFELTSSVVNKGGEKTFKAKLDRAVSREVRTKIIAASNGTLTSEFYSLTQAGMGSSANGEVLTELVFPADTTELEFVVNIGNSLAKAGESYVDDKLINLEFKEEFTDSSARTNEKVVLAIYVNEWLNTLNLSSQGNALSIKSMQLDKNQNVLLIGDILNSSGNRDGVFKTFNRKGEAVSIGLDEIVSSTANGEVTGAAIASITRPNPAKTGDDDKELIQVVAVFNATSENNGIGGKDIRVRGFERVVNVNAYTLKWEKVIGTQSDDTATSVALDTSGNAYIAGYTLGSIPAVDTKEALPNMGGADGYIAKLDTNGAIVWQTLLSSAGEDIITSIDMSGANLVVGGTTTDRIASTGKGGKDLFVVKYGVNGSKSTNDQQIGTYLDDELTSVATSSTGVFVTGYTQGDINNAAVGDEDIKDVDHSSVDFYTFSLDSRSELISYAHTGTENTDQMNKILSLDTQALVGGFVEGGFNGSNSLGGKDALIAAYETDLAKINGTDANASTAKDMKLLWSVQFGGAEDDSIIDLDVFKNAKLFSLSSSFKAGELNYILQPRESISGVELSK